MMVSFTPEVKIHFSGRCRYVCLGAINLSMRQKFIGSVMSQDLSEGLTSPDDVIYTATIFW